MELPVLLTVVIELLLLKFHSTSSGSTYHEQVNEKKKKVEGMSAHHSLNSKGSCL
jgi:hypothetical protein